MLVKLPESAPARKRSFGGTAVSTLLHALVIGGTVAATGGIAERVSQPEPPVGDIIYVAPRPKPDPAPPAPAQQQQVPTNEVPSTPVEIKPIDFSIIPTTIPSPEARIGNVGVDRFRELARDSVPVGPATPTSDEPFTESMVEEVVKLRPGNPAPRYPSMLASAGVEGVVYAQFVVDTAGRVEPESIRFPKSDHQLFERSVREVLLRSRYSPAKVGNHSVRQLVEQAFSFNLKR